MVASCFLNLQTGTKIFQQKNRARALFFKKITAGPCWEHLSQFKDSKLCLYEWEEPFKWRSSVVGRAAPIPRCWWKEEGMHNCGKVCSFHPNTSRPDSNVGHKPRWNCELIQLLRKPLAAAGVTWCAWQPERGESSAGTDQPWAGHGKGRFVKV